MCGRRMQLILVHKMQCPINTFGITRDPGYESIFAGASYDIAKHFTPILRIDNLLNERYEEVLGYQALSRSILGGVRIHW